jgi:hypothetical protein
MDVSFEIFRGLRQIFDTERQMTGFAAILCRVSSQDTALKNQDNNPQPQRANHTGEGLHEAFRAKKHSLG